MNEEASENEVKEERDQVRPNGGGIADTDTAIESPDFDYISGELVHAVQIYYTPVLVIFGTVGNLISILVFFNSKLWKVSTSHYLCALAVSDTCFLLQLLVAWLDAVNICSVINTPGFCQVSVYITYVTCNSSAWLVVAFTVERLVAVKHPLKRTIVCTVTRANYVILILTAFALLVNVPLLRFAKAAPRCNLDALYWKHADRFNVVDTMISFTLPMATISLLNVWIAVGVFNVWRNRRNLVRHTPSEASRESVNRTKINTMLFTVSTIFVILNLPAYTIRMLAYDSKVQDTDENWISWQHVSLALFNTNFGINFALYCLVGQNFRRAMGQCVSHLWRAITKVCGCASPPPAQRIRRQPTPHVHVFSKISKKYRCRSPRTITTTYNARVARCRSCPPTWLSPVHLPIPREQNDIPLSQSMPPRFETEECSAPPSSPDITYSPSLSESVLAEGVNNEEQIEPSTWKNIFINLIKERVLRQPRPINSQNSDILVDGDSEDNMKKFIHGEVKIEIFKIIPDKTEANENDYNAIIIDQPIIDQEHKEKYDNCNISQDAYSQCEIHGATSNVVEQPYIEDPQIFDPEENQLEETKVPKKRRLAKRRKYKTVGNLRMVDMQN